MDHFSLIYGDDLLPQKFKDKPIRRDNKNELSANPKGGSKHKSRNDEDALQSKEEKKHERKEFEEVVDELKKTQPEALKNMNKRTKKAIRKSGG